MCRITISDVLPEQNLICRVHNTHTHTHTHAQSTNIMNRGQTLEFMSLRITIIPICV